MKRHNLSLWMHFFLHSVLPPKTSPSIAMFVRPHISTENPPASPMETTPKHGPHASKDWSSACNLPIHPKYTTLRSPFSPWWEHGCNIIVFQKSAEIDWEEINLVSEFWQPTTTGRECLWGIFFWKVPSRYFHHGFLLLQWHLVWYLQVKIPN